MARLKSDNVQINISIPSEWKKELENLARIYSVEEGETITFLDLMRRGIQEKYQLGEKNERGTISQCFALQISDTVSHHLVSEIQIFGIKRQCRGDIETDITENL